MIDAVVQDYQTVQHSTRSILLVWINPEDMSDKDLIDLIVQLDGFHGQEIIEFVGYDERSVTSIVAKDRLAKIPNERDWRNTEATLPRQMTEITSQRCSTC
jgi:hypothetical protein